MITDQLGKTEQEHNKVASVYPQLKESIEELKKLNNAIDAFQKQLSVK